MKAASQKSHGKTTVLCFSFREQLNNDENFSQQKKKK